MENFDVGILLALAVFGFFGWRSGLLKKLMALLFLIIAIFVGAMYATTVSHAILSSFKLPESISAGAAFLIIVLGIMMIQSLIYGLVIKRMVDGIWNHIGGMFVGVFEGALFVSVMLIFLSISLQVPSQQVRDDSILYKPLRNFAPKLFDSAMTMIPDSHDFYEEILSSTGL
jgi:uncharacterized membrane protein required for colicin V production